MEADKEQLLFARKLASNDKEVRYQTLTNLGKLFSKSVHPMKEEDLLRIWMGLFYAMWMSDKPVVQRELGESISKLIHTHSNPDNAILFIKTFYTTMHRQFPLIDRLRHDKYLKFVRFFVHHSLAFIKNQEYDSEIIEKYIKAQTNIWEVDDAQEIQLHVCDLFFDELFYACGNEIPSAAIFQFADLFVQTLVKTNHQILKTRLFEALRAFILGASYCSPKLAPKKKHGMDTDKSLFPDVEFVTISLEELETWFMARAMSKDKIQNRDLLYQLKDEALKKKRAEPGFKVLPRGSITKKVAEVEDEEYKRLMADHRKAQAALPKDEVVNSKKEKLKKRKMAQKVNGQEVKDVEEEEKKMNGKNGKKGKKEKRAEAPVVAVAPVPEEKVEEPKNKKQKVQVETPTPTPTPTPTTTTTVVTKKQKKNAKGEVVGKVEEKVETVVTEDATSKQTEVTTTTTSKAVKKTPVKKDANKQVEEVEDDEKPEEKPVEKKRKVDEKKGKGKGKKVEEKVDEEVKEDKPVDITPKKKAIPTPATNGNSAAKKRKAPENDTPVATNGKKKQQVVAEEKEEREEAVVEETPVSAKKGKKAKKENGTTVTPQKSGEAVTPPSTGKKSVRFSKDNHVKEFHILEEVTTPVTPSSTKPKSVLTTPPSKGKVPKKK